MIEAKVLEKGARAVDVLVEAEMEGSRYNVPEGQITRSHTFLNGVDTIANGADWITREGSDTEDDDRLETRTLRSWSEFAARPIEDTFINAAEGVLAVLLRKWIVSTLRGKARLTSSVQARRVCHHSGVDGGSNWAQIYQGSARPPPTPWPS